jgi:hypothetical protein
MSFGFRPATIRPENFEPAWYEDREFEWKDFIDWESQFSIFSKVDSLIGKKLLGWPLLDPKHDMFDMLDSLWEL